MSDGIRRRRRQAISCTLCRKRKIRCDRKYPCGNCTRSRNGICVFEKDAVRNESSSSANHSPAGDVAGTNRSPSNVGITTATPSLDANQPATTLSPSSLNTGSALHDFPAVDYEGLLSKNMRLQSQLAKPSPKPLHSASTETPRAGSKPGKYTVLSRLGDKFDIDYDQNYADQSRGFPRSVFHKTRRYGSSHWMNGVFLFRDLMEILEPLIHLPTSKIFNGLQTCKSLGRVVKASREPPWPTVPTPDLPSREISDILLENYIQTTENLYRIAHLPSLRREYEAVWELNAQPDKTFLIQLKVMLAIGAVTYDDRFSLRSSAIRWIFEAQTWLAGPRGKSRLNLQALQTHILVLIARELVNVGGGLVWVSAGELLRQAILMGLHRAPPASLSAGKVAPEMRLRLWNTILELSVQSSISTGAPPLISSEDFDADLPSNLDDDELLQEDSTPRPDDELTDVSLARAFRNTFDARLAVANFLNRDSYGTYEDMLRIDISLRATYKELCRSLQACSRNGKTLASTVGMRKADLIMNRYFLALHAPFFGAGPDITAYAYSRKTVVDTALKIWYMSYPWQADGEHFTSVRPESSTTSETIGRLLVCGAGLLHMGAMQAVVLLAAEIRMQIKEQSTTLEAGPIRSDLITVLAQSEDWCVRCMKAGETSIKGFLLVSLIRTAVNANRQGLEKKETAELIIKATEDSIETRLPLLEDMLAQAQGLTEPDEWSKNPDEWYSMNGGPLLNASDADLLTLMFGEDAAAGLSFW